MRTIYRDSEYKCHVSNDGTMTAVEAAFFDGKCDAYVEGYRLLLTGESWTRSDGVVFHGEMLAPWRPCPELAAAQRQYETMLAAMDAAYQEGVESA